MRLLGLLAVVALAAPTIGTAQSVPMSALVGTWVRPHIATAPREVLEGKLPLEQMMQMKLDLKSDTAEPKMRAVLAGWEKAFTKGDTLVIQTDSTFRWTGGAFNRWNYLKGDTLSLYPNGACFTGATETTKTGKRCDAVCYRPATPEKPGNSGSGSGDCFRGEPGYQVVLKDQHLFLLLLKGTTGDEEGIYKRVDTPKPTP